MPASAAGVAGAAAVWAPAQLAPMMPSAFAAAVATVGMLCLFNPSAGSLQLLDRPDARRKCHAAPVPMTGGLALVAGAWGGAAVSGDVAAHLALLILIALVGFVHLVDDRNGLSAPLRLGLDGLLALGFILLVGGTIDSLGESGSAPVALGYLALPVTIFAYLAVTNAFNMVDGVDGLAITQFLITTLMLVSWETLHLPESRISPPALALISSALVLLLANTGALGRPLKCFLGDSGARMLGFFLVWALVRRDEAVLAPVEALFLVALPVLDMAAVATERLAAGQSPMRGDRRHLHHLLLDAGLHGRQVVLAMGALSMLLACLPFVLDGLAVGQGAGWALFAVILIGYGAVRHPLARVLARLAAAAPAPSAGDRLAQAPAATALELPAAATERRAVEPDLQ